MEKKKKNGSRERENTAQIHTCKCMQLNIYIIIILYIISILILLLLILFFFIFCYFSRCLSLDNVLFYCQSRSVNLDLSMYALLSLVKLDLSNFGKFLKYCLIDWFEVFISIFLLSYFLLLSALSLLVVVFVVCWSI